MILLTKDSTNEMNIICDDVLTASNPVYLWRFVSQVERTEHLIELINSAEQNRRYDRFELVLPDDLDLSEGEYIYEVYQSTTPGDEDYSNMPLLANGIAKVQATFTDSDSYEPTGQDTTYRG